MKTFAIQPSNTPIVSDIGPHVTRAATFGSTMIPTDGSWGGLLRPMPSSGALELDWQRVFSIHIVDLTGIFTVCCLMAADFGSVIFSTPLEKSVFTDLGSGPNGSVIERENLPNVRS